MKVFVYLVLMFSMTNCNKEETKDGLEGRWFLVNATGGIGGISQIYPKGDISWTFENGKLKIINNYSGQWNVSPPTMEKDYKIVSTADGNELHLANAYFVNFQVSKDSLLLNQLQFADGFSFVLVR
jgi:O-glycosyl hydrolase